MGGPGHPGKEAYPRPRGGADFVEIVTIGRMGLSPPARGSQGRRPGPERGARPIPARAGEPHGIARPRGYVAAYPRPRGGAILRLQDDRIGQGLSPPPRGSPRHTKRRSGLSWPIPARAGEPLTPHDSASLSRAYPRPRGGAHHLAGKLAAAGGLSPPARGSLVQQVCGRRVLRPIPARAGEPPTVAAVTLGFRAYPRPRGGAG